MSRIFDIPDSQPVNDTTIADGVVIAATGVRLLNTESGRIYGGLIFQQARGAVENAAGGIIGLSRDQSIYDQSTSVTGSAGADTLVNAGTVKGKVALGDGDDSYVERGTTGSVDLGAGDDRFRFETGGADGHVDGGEGRDLLTIATANVAYGASFTGFEDLALAGSGNFQGVGFSGFRSIAFQGTGSFGLFDSANASVAVTLDGQSLRLGNSSLAAVTGSARSEVVELVNGARIAGDISLGDSDDKIVFSDNDGRTSTIGGTVDGGAGRDMVQLSWFEQSDHWYDFNRVRGMEVLSVNGDRVVSGISHVDIVHADGFQQIWALRGTALTLSTSNSPDANATIIGASLTLDEGTTLRRIGSPEDGPFEQSVDLTRTDDSTSTTIVNRGAIAGEVRFYVGDDFYDGTAGAVGGTVYGNAGNDTLLGGAGAEHLSGNYGADRIEGNGGDDVLDGGAGGDTIAGGAGTDTLTGGAGDDRFVGTRADLAGDTITDLAVGDRIVVRDASLDGFAFTRVGGQLDLGQGAVLTLGGGVTGRLVAGAAADGGVALTVASRDAHLGDLDGDGHSDLLWTSAGAVSSWALTGNGRGDQIAYNSFFASVPASWHVIETFDFDRDGRSDILWRNDNGALSVWTATSGGFWQGAYDHAAVAQQWTIAATGDLGGDGRDDILWRDTGGALSVWSATGQGFVENSYSHSAVGASWKVAGLADLDGDGRNDIIWRNDDGAVSTWLSRGTGFTESAFYDVGVARSWHIDGLADFDGDGRADILWRNDDGAVSVWRSTGTGFTENVYASAAATDWHIIQTGDFNDDGRGDILWRNDGGALSSWQSNGDGFDQDVLHDDGPAAGWTVAAHDFIFG